MQKVWENSIYKMGDCMKKYMRLGAAIVMGGTFLVGCSSNQSSSSNETVSGEHLESLDKFEKMEVQKIESSSTIFSLTDSEEIELLIQNLKMEQWNLSKIPENLEAKYEFLIYGEDTEQQLTDSSDLGNMDRLIIYPYEPYIEYKIGKVRFAFEIPDDTVAYLAEFLGEN